MATTFVDYLIIYFTITRVLDTEITAMKMDKNLMWKPEKHRFERKCSQACSL